MLLIREARPDERGAIRELTLLAYGEYEHTMAPKAWVELRGAIMSGLASADNAAWLVAERDGALIGSVLLYPPNVAAYSSEAITPNAFPEVRLLSVPANLRGQGIARALMGECIRRARALGSASLGLHTSESMKAARALYSALGFERAPELDFATEGSEVVEGFRLSVAPAQGDGDRT